MRYCIITLCSIFIFGAIVSFGHSVNRSALSEDGTCSPIIACMNSMFLGATWPFYFSYVYFESADNDK